MYAAGVSTKQDYTQSARWLQLAAEQGHADALSFLESLDKKGDAGSADGSNVRRNSSREVELYLAAQISETLDELQYSVLKRCDPEMVFEIAKGALTRMYELGKNIDVR